ncbi:hypothetical protein PN473_11995 [Dolichospermum circinale CS-545/17]|nr:hypothetical protein [Dolichospermum circinale CS-545/17]
MVNNNFNVLYEELVKKVRVLNQSRNSETGRLYKTIQIIVGEEKSQSSVRTREICDYFGIKSDSSIEEDKEIIDNLLDVIFVDNKVFRESAKILNKTATFLSNCNIGGNMEWIFIVTGLTLVGGIIYNQLSSKQKDQESQESELKEEKQEPSYQSPLPVDLCLIIPASIASNLETGSTLNFDQLIEIIDSASYFLCITDANSTVKLNTTDDAPLSDSKREFYLEIRINNGRNLIDKKRRYYLKENLKEDVQSDIKKLMCLRDLSGLEKFNRV